MKTGHFNFCNGVVVCLALVLIPPSLRANDNPNPYSHLRSIWKTPAHSNGFTRAVLFSPDGTRLISAGDDGRVSFIQRSDGAILTNVVAHSTGVRGLALRGDGSLVASGGDDGFVKLWRTTDAALSRSFVAHTTTVASVAFSPDGTVLATAGGPDNLVKLWRVADGELIRTIPSTQAPSTFPSMLSVAFSPDGRQLAGSGAEVWSAEDGRLIRPASTLGDLDVKFSPDGTRVLLQELYIVWVVNLAHGGVESVPSVNFRPWSAFSPDGISLFSVSMIGDAVWADFRNRTIITSYSCQEGGCTDRYTSVAFDPQMRAVGVGTEAGEIILAELPVWLSQIQRNGATLTIQWQGGTGPFQLQRLTDLSSQNWTNIGPEVTGNAISIPFDENEPTAFYRVRDLKF